MKRRVDNFGNKKERDGYLKWIASTNKPVADILTDHIKKASANIDSVMLHEKLANGIAQQPIITSKIMGSSVTL